jgi:hypothetical protein
MIVNISKSNKKKLKKKNTWLQDATRLDDVGGGGGGNASGDGDGGGHHHHLESNKNK